MEFEIGDRVAKRYIATGAIIYYSQPEIITDESKLYWITDRGNRISKSTHRIKGCGKYDTGIYVLYTLEIQIEEERKKVQREKREILETNVRELVATHKLSLSQLQYIADIVEV